MIRIFASLTRASSVRLRFAVVSGMLAVSTAMMGALPARADSHAADEAYIKYRQSVMSIVGTHMGAIADIMKNGLDVPGAIAQNAAQMAEAASLIAPAFRRPITAGPTDSKAEIWEDWAKFEQAIADYEQAARELAIAASADDPSRVGPAMKALGGSCGGCHKPFRKPKEESYKSHDHKHH